MAGSASDERAVASASADPALVPDADTVLANAARATGLDDFGDADDPGFRSRVAMLLDNARKSDLDLKGVRALCDVTHWHLSTRLQLMEDRKVRPIADEVIDRPIIATGEARSGTTLLHALLAEDPDARAMRFWQVYYPSPPTGMADAADARIQQANDDWRDILARIPKWLISHPYNDDLGLGLPECERFWGIDFRGAPPTGWWRVPAGGLGAGLPQDHSRQYKIHRMQLQQAQFGAPKRRWALKGTSHHRRLDAVLDAYPDATLVWTHRDPVQIVASFTQLYGQIQEGILGREVDRRALAAQTLSGMRASIAATMANPRVDADQVVHVSYSELHADPIATVEAVYLHTGHTVSSDHAGRMRQWIDSHGAGRYGKFTYPLDVITEPLDSLYDEFAPYMERFRVRRESER